MTHGIGSRDASARKTPIRRTASLSNEVTPTPQLLYQENFTNQEKGWYLSDRSGYTRTFVNGSLILQDTNQKTLIESLPKGKTYDDFTVNVSFSMLTGDENDSVGVYLRGDSNLDHDYRLDIYGDRTYGLSKEDLGESNLPENTPLIGPDQTAALKDMGQKNTLSVTMRGSTISISINDQFITTLTDTAYTKGQVALFVNNGATSNGVTAAFHSIEIYSAPTSSDEQK